MCLSKPNWDPIQFVASNIHQYWIIWVIKLTIFYVSLNRVLRLSKSLLYHCSYFGNPKKNRGGWFFSALNTTNPFYSQKLMYIFVCVLTWRMQKKNIILRTLLQCYRIVIVDPYFGIISKSHFIASNYELSWVIMYILF